MFRGDWGNTTSKQMPRIGDTDSWHFCKVWPHLPCLPLAKTLSTIFALFNKSVSINSFFVRFQVEMYYSMMYNVKCWAVLFCRYLQILV